MFIKITIKKTKDFNIIDLYEIFFEYLKFKWTVRTSNFGHGVKIYIQDMCHGSY